jgi:hypothetical protein
MDINELQYPYIIIESLKNNHLQHNFGCKRVKMIGYGNNSTSITECYSDGYKIQRLFAAIANKGQEFLLTLYLITGTPDRIRTCDLWLRRPTLYPAELRAHG